MLFFAPKGFPYKAWILASQQVGECTISIEADDESALRVRVQPGHPQCYATNESLLDLLSTEFSRVGGSEEVYTSVSLGRIIDYPWLSEYIATSAYTDPQWQRNRGKPRSRDTYGYVSKILLRSPFAAQLNEVLARKGYFIHAVTVEKVLIGTFRDVPLYAGKAGVGKVPYDAVVWLRLRKKLGFE